MKKTSAQNHSIYSGNLILVNSDNPIQKPIEENMFTPIAEKSNIRLERRAAVLLCELMSEINGWGFIAPVSGWRSANEQRQIWDNTKTKHGMAFTKKYVAAPGHSEHQTGLAIDLGLKQEDMDFLRPDFPYSGICRTFRKKAAGYGFIERYPVDKEHITGIAHEPWHFRFVGIPHAEIICSMCLSLEEYHDYIKRFHHMNSPLTYETHGQKFNIFFLPKGERGIIPDTHDNISHMISGNNMDGFVITEWKM